MEIKKFLLQVVLFGVKLLSILIFLTFIASKNHEFFPSLMYYSDDYNKAFSSEDYDILILGNSKVLGAIDKTELEQLSGNKVAHLGYSSSNISLSKLVLESYLNQGIQPKTVILEVSWITFNPHRTALHEISGDLFLRDLRLWKNFYKYSEGRLPKSIKLAWLRSLLKYFYWNKANDVSAEDNFRPSTPNSKDYSFDLNTFNHFFPSHTSGVDSLLLNDFLDLVDLCQLNDIKLIMFVAPEDEAYTNLQLDKEEVFANFYAAEHRDSNTYFLDYTLGGPLYEKAYENWMMDSHHINDKKLFTSKFFKDLKLYSIQLR